MGHIKHAFELSFHFLYKYDGSKTYYHDSIRSVIQLGGDTDTNACIVGGMLGALCGIKNIPDNMIQ